VCSINQIAHEQKIGIVTALSVKAETGLIFLYIPFCVLAVSLYIRVNERLLYKMLFQQVPLVTTYLPAH